MKPVTAFIRFCRPHTIAGTLLSISSLYLIAHAFSDTGEKFVMGFIFTLLSCLGANIYIVGLNQITDVEIDKINKPYLPLASGEFSVKTAYGIISLAVVISFAIAFYMGNYLLLTVLLSLLLGTAYSLPPFRLKRYHFWAAFCIIAVRGVIVNLFLFLHFHYSMSYAQNIPLIIWALTATIFIYSVVIAWFKDIPDMEGDRIYSINTLTLSLGAKTVFYLGNLLLLSTTFLNLLLAFWYPLAVHTPTFAIFHVVMAAVLVTGILKTDISQKKSMRKFYLLIWMLFFLEYISYAVAATIL